MGLWPDWQSSYVAKKLLVSYVTFRLPTSRCQPWSFNLVDFEALQRRTRSLCSKAPLVAHGIQWRWNEFESGGGGTCPAQSAGFFWSCPFTFFGSKSTISRLGERFRDGQYSLVSILFAVLLLTVPPCSAICKSGGTCPPCLWSRSHWLHHRTYVSTDIRTVRSPVPCHDLMTWAGFTRHRCDAGCINVALHNITYNIWFLRWPK